MNNVDKQYLNILKDIVEYGNYKSTRSGQTLSLFGKQMRFNLKEGFPLLTTKKVFVKGIIYELLWFINGDTNINFLVKNNVHIWDDDAYRFYLEKCQRNGKQAVNKDIFIKKTLLRATHSFDDEKYTYGDLGPIYGEQWRNGKFDQIENIINTLKNNPDDRRMILSAWNINDLDNMALPPCHAFAEFYARKMNNMERLDWLCLNSNTKQYDEYKTLADEVLDAMNVPKYALSCMFLCRSQDFPLGTPYNIASYALLTHMIAQCCNMDVDELIWNGGDCHIYLNQIDAVKEQLKRSGYAKLPKLILNKNIKNINEFTYNDIEIVDYQCNDAIKIPLSVGL